MVWVVGAGGSGAKWETTYWEWTKWERAKWERNKWERMHTDMHTPTRTHTHAHSHALTHTHTHTRTLTRTHTHARFDAPLKASAAGRCRSRPTGSRRGASGAGRACGPKPPSRAAIYIAPPPSRAAIYSTAAEPRRYI